MFVPGSYIIIYLEGMTNYGNSVIFSRNFMGASVCQGYLSYVRYTH
jgi:hypothetical protein